MEDLTVTLYNQQETFWDTRRLWQHFVYTNAYKREVSHPGWTPGNPETMALGELLDFPYFFESLLSAV